MWLSPACHVKFVHIRAVAKVSHLLSLWLLWRKNLFKMGCFHGQSIWINVSDPTSVWGKNDSDLFYYVILYKFCEWPQMQMFSCFPWRQPQVYIVPFLGETVKTFFLTGKKKKSAAWFGCCMSNLKYLWQQTSPTEKHSLCSGLS